MNKRVLMLIAAITAVAVLNPAHAATFIIGDNDGYGMGIADGAPAPFTTQLDVYDGRGDGEKAAVNGAQFTDTYSTAHPDFSPQGGTLATFTFSNLDGQVNFGSLKVDMAGFEATRFGSVSVSFNGITQEAWAFDDGISGTKVRDFELSQAVIASINSFDELVITVDRNKSNDFYGFDYLQLTTNNGTSAVVPLPGAVWLFGTGIASLLGFTRKRKA